MAQEAKCCLLRALLFLFYRLVRLLFGARPVFARSVSNTSVLFQALFCPGITASTIGRTFSTVRPTAETTDRALVTSEKIPVRSTIPLCSTTGSLLPNRIALGCPAVAERCNLLQIAMTLEKCHKLSQTVAKRCNRALLNALQFFTKKHVQNPLSGPLPVGSRISATGRSDGKAGTQSGR